MIGRHLEQDSIVNLLKSKKSEFLVVYGRRRVGKTFLVRRVCKNQIVFDFTGSYNVKHRDQLINFFHVYLERTQGAKETTVPV